MLRAAIALLLLLSFVSTAFAQKARVYVLTGQGGRATSGGIAQLANSLAQDKRLTVSIHSWKNYNDVVRDLWAGVPADTPVIIIGYSLGANAATWIADSQSGRFHGIDLLVAYDPSVLAVMKPVPWTTKRILLYHNTSIGPYGHARIDGLNVETTETRMAHLRVDWSTALHKRTRAAIEQVLGKRK